MTLSPSPSVSEILGAEQLRAEAPARGHAHRRARDFAAAFEARGDRARCRVEPRDPRAEPEDHAPGLQHPPQVGRHLGIETRKDLAFKSDHGDGRTQITKSARHLEPDRAGADQRETRGELGQEEQVVRGDGQLAARDVGDHWLRSGRDEDLVPGQPRAVHLDGVGVHEARPSEDYARARLLYRGDPRLEGGDDLALPPEHRRPIEPDIVRRRAVLRRVPHQRVNPAGLDQGLFRNSAAIDAGAAERPRIDERDARAGLGGGLEGVDPGGAASDHEQVVTVHSVTSVTS